MIHEVKKLSNEELFHLYITESYKLLAGFGIESSHNSMQALKRNVFYLDQEIDRRKSVTFYREAG